MPNSMLCAYLQSLLVRVVVLHGNKEVVRRDALERRERLAEGIGAQRPLAVGEVLRLVSVRECDVREVDVERSLRFQDVVDDRGLPRGAPTIEVPGAENLFFVGYWAKVSGQIRQMRFEARRVARTAKHRKRESTARDRPGAATASVTG